MTSTYLKAGGLNYRVDGLFLWGCASWDQLGVHPGSYSEQGTYRERGVVAIVNAHNGAVNNIPQVQASAKVLPWILAVVFLLPAVAGLVGPGLLLTLQLLTHDTLYIARHITHPKLRNFQFYKRYRITVLN